MRRVSHLRSDQMPKKSEPAAAGHNSNQQLASFINRVERLAEEKQALTYDIGEVYGEAKGCGFNPKIMRRIVAIRKKDRDKWKEEEKQVDLYLEALGML